MKIAYFYISLLLLTIQINEAETVSEPIVLSIAQINNLDNQLSETEYSQFQATLEICLQEKQGFFSLINSEYDKLFIESLRRIKDPTTLKDLFAGGQLRNEDYIALIDLSKKRGTLSVTYEGIMRLYNRRTGEFMTFDEIDKSIRNLATTLAQKIFERLWQGTIIITVDRTPFFLMIDRNKTKITTNRYETLQMLGKHELTAQKKGFRPHNRTIDVEAGKKYNWNISFTLKGAELKLEGIPIGSKVTLEGERNKYQGELPFQSTLPEGKYNLNISHSGFYPYRDKVVIKDGKDIYSRVELLDIYWVTMRNRSLIFAGIGQYYYGDQAKGTIFTVLEAAGLLAGGILTYLYVREKNDRDNLYSKYRNEIDPNRARLLHNSISNKEDWMGIYQGGLISAFVTAAIIYSYNIFDVYSYRKVQSKRSGERTVRQAEEIFDELEEEENNLNE